MKSHRAIGWILFITELVILIYFFLWKDIGFGVGGAVDAKVVKGKLDEKEERPK